MSPRAFRIVLTCEVCRDRSWRRGVVELGRWSETGPPVEWFSRLDGLRGFLAEHGSTDHSAPFGLGFALLADLPPTPAIDAGARLAEGEGTLLSRLVNEALQVDGGHHKQWYLEQIARQFELNVDGDHQPGIAP